MMKLPTIITAPSTYLGIQHPETLVSVADGNSVKLQVQHGGWPAAGVGQSASAASRTHQFLFVNNPPEPNTGFKVEGVAFTFTPQASA
jgi:exo-beta-1,3-glucanase (GH17 family)